jgi:hypothetical protein
MAGPNRSTGAGNRGAALCVVPFHPLLHGHGIGCAGGVRRGARLLRRPIVRRRVGLIFSWRYVDAAGRRVASTESGSGSIFSRRSRLSLRRRDRNVRPIRCHFAASTNRSDFNDTWIRDGRTWTQVFPPISPAARRFDNQGMAYDPRNATVVLFGGITGSDTVLGDTWTWNGKAKTWTSHPVTGPSPRRAPLVYDDATGAVILFGGDDVNKAFGDTREWTGSSWLQRFPPTSPQRDVIDGL